MEHKTEEQKCEDLENCSVILLYYLSKISFWSRWWGKPTFELKDAIEKIHNSIGIMSAHIELCNLKNKERCIALIERAEKLLGTILKGYPSLKVKNEKDQKLLRCNSQRIS